jgi:hypothetical protein
VQCPLKKRSKNSDIDSIIILPCIRHLKKDVSDCWLFFILIQWQEQITNLKRRLRSWATVNKNGNFPWSGWRMLGFPNSACRFQFIKKKQTKPNKVALLKQFRMLLFSYFGPSLQIISTDRYQHHILNLNIYHNLQRLDKTSNVVSGFVITSHYSSIGIWCQINKWLKTSMPWEKSKSCLVENLKQRTT